MKTFIFLFTLLLSNTLSSLPESKEMCNCLSKAKNSNSTSDKKYCLVLQEKHVKKLKDGSKNHEAYKQEVANCERKLFSTPLKEATYEEKVKLVCNCFSNAIKKRIRPMSCFKLQDDYSKTVGEKKVQFTQETNSCVN